jgi:hypothetical protein
MNLRTYKFHKIIDCEKNNYWLYKLAKKNVLTKHTFENFTLSNLSMIRVLELSFTHLTKIQAVGIPLQTTKEQLQTGLRENKGGRAHRVKAFVRVDDKKELIDPPRIQEKEFEEPATLSARSLREFITH